MGPWLFGAALAAEPLVEVPDPRAPGGLRAEVVLTWSEVGLAPARVESPAIGPDRVAAGPGDLVAVHDPVGGRVVVPGVGAVAVQGVDGLAFTASGVLLVMDDRARRLRSFDIEGALLDDQPFPGVVAGGGVLVVDGELVLSVDVFGNGHPLAFVGATGALTPPAEPALVPPARRVVRQGAMILVDGRAVASVGARGGARLLGDWLLVESLDAGVVTRRAIPLEGGDAVELPARERIYAPAQDVSVGPDGDLAWIDPRADGLHLVRVSP
jgi:hypothetical protein